MNLFRFEVAPGTDVFLSHTWGKDESDCDDHRHLWLIYKRLKKLVYQTWFDEERMASDIAEKMFKEIVQAKGATIYNTQRHHNKVNSTNANHNCKLEFDYASRKKTSSTIVFMEKCMCGADVGPRWLLLA